MDPLSESRYNFSRPATTGYPPPAINTAASSSMAPNLQVPQHHQYNPQPPGNPFRPTFTPAQRSSIRIQRLSQQRSVGRLRQSAARDSRYPQTDAEDGRRRSSSEPQRPQWTATYGAGPTAGLPMSPLVESITPTAPSAPVGQTAPVSVDRLAPVEQNPGMLRRASVAAMNALGVSRNHAHGAAAPSLQQREAYGSQIVDILDLVDPEVSTLSTLTNVQNSLFIPDLGPILNRRPTYTLTRLPPSPVDEDEASSIEEKESEETETETETGGYEAIRPRATRLHTVSTITSTLSESRYAVLPHGASLEGWSAGEKKELNDYVRHMLHSRRSKIWRGLRGFGKYVRRPLGFLVTLYATLITLFGLAWVLFLIGWINVGGKQLYVINVIDNVLVALFAIVGDGLAPFRVVDTYHLIYIAHYHRLTWQLRKKKRLPQLEDKNDLPSRRQSQIDPEDGILGLEEFTVLTPLQQNRLAHHQNKFSKSHTFYKPHETETHHAFSIHLLIAIVVLLDCHSLFQIALGTCTWAISYHVRPFALTTVILCCSITCNITAGILITIGDRRTRKKDVIERMLRQELTQEAIDKMAKRKKKEKKRNKAPDEEPEVTFEGVQPYEGA